MRTAIRPSILCSIAAALILLVRSSEAGAVSAAPDQYDPRRDPNYSRETLEKPPVNWDAIWALVREFEARAYPNVNGSQVPAPYAQPQPRHYVEGAPSLSGSPPLSAAPIYGSPYIRSWYAHGPSFSGWWGTSPRIPWWSLIPFRSHHAHGHHHTGHW